MTEFAPLHGTSADDDDSEDCESEKGTDDYSDDSSDEEEDGSEDQVEVESSKASDKAHTLATESGDQPAIAEPAIQKTEQMPKTYRVSNIPLEQREKAVYVTVNRDPEIQAARLQLPITGEEQV